MKQAVELCTTVLSAIATSSLDFHEKSPPLSVRTRGSTHYRFQLNDVGVFAGSSSETPTGRREARAIKQHPHAPRRAAANV